MPKMQLTQSKITDTALSIAEQQGFEAVTMANIARALSIKPPSLYNHFKNLEEIKIAMALIAQQKLYEALKDQDTLLSLAKSYVNFSKLHAGLYTASLCGGTGETGHAIVQLFATTPILAELEETERTHAIRGFRSMVHGFIDLQYYEGFKMDVDLEESLVKMVSVFERGLGC
ncbi:TetR/AcrR family transcriptional regulator [Terribacillus sp. DMT04]|uniref:TetR/AcrR family transcriptional regulator n=1 Tax=Terribacillus sp. DMT04 TaxID=2850441 RepID=UPI001C2BF418|nr:TetR/AcrR family transcriptional regulator [Terribacillus sp. DMT04]QXE00639.1 TetR/AcrR family transcriptional regulator [Terribacillus sp. DMT04]